MVGIAFFFFYSLTVITKENWNWKYDIIYGNMLYLIFLPIMDECWLWTNSYNYGNIVKLWGYYQQISYKRNLYLLILWLSKHSARVKLCHVVVLSRDSAVCIQTGYRPVDWGFGVWVSVGAGFSSAPRHLGFSGADRAYCPVVTGALSVEGGWNWPPPPPPSS
jgi:hypothetical protein